MSQLTVSVILPAYNAGAGLKGALERVRLTCPTSGEIILIDDGSADETLSIMQGFANSQSNVKLIELAANRGVAHARNEGLRVAAAQYVWFVDWDDEWDLDIVRALHRRAISTDADVVVCGARWRDSSGLDLGRVETLPQRRELDGAEGIEAVLRGHLRGYLWAKLFKRAVLPEGMFPMMQSQSDFCGVVPIIAASDVIVIDPTVLYWHVIREGSITNTRDPRLENLTLCREVVKQSADRLPQTKNLRRLLRFYDYAFWLLARVNTAVRLSSPRQAEEEIRNALGYMRWGHLVKLTFISLPVATRACLIMLTRTHYPAVRRAMVGVRDRARRRRTAYPLSRG